MAVGCGAKCAKALLIIFNLIFWLSGCALLALGIWILIDSQRDALFNLISKDSDDVALLKYLAYGLVAIGGLVLVVGFIGCCGALKESKCLLITYFIFLFVVLAAELAIGVLAVIYREQLLSTMDVQLTQRIKGHYGLTEHNALTLAVDFTQFRFKCCGINNGDDYVNSTWSKGNHSGNALVPKTCCFLANNGTKAWMDPTPTDTDKCQKETGDELAKYRYIKGCKDNIQDWVKTESTLLIAVGLGVASLEIFGMIFAICLCRNLGEEQ